MARCFRSAFLLLAFIVLTNDGISQIAAPKDTSIVSNIPTDTIIIKNPVDTNKTIQPNETKTINKYLVLESKSIYTRDRVYKEGKRLKVKTYDGRKMRGRLLIANDTTIVLYNTMNGRLDSFELNDIRLIRNVTLFTSVIGVYYLSYAPIFIVAGIVELSYGDAISNIIGTFFILSGTGAYVVGIELLEGFRKSRSDFNYHIYQAKGFKLKPKMVNDLYP